MAASVLDFGFYPGPLELSVGPVSVRSLPSREKTVADLLESDGIEGDWIYSPQQQVRNFLSGNVTDRPYTARVFGLPKTHQIEHAADPDADRLTFHLWSLSFFTGIRLTGTEAGFLDATPLKPHTLVDFVAFGRSLERSIELTQMFWEANASEPRQARRFAAAVHALFLGENPRNLQFEDVIYLYAALDACFGMAAVQHPPSKRLRHADRTEWMCDLYGVPSPLWAKPSGGSPVEIAVIRNDTLHEALFMGEPLGFALHGVGTSHNLPLEMRALVSRLLVSIIGGEADYVQTPVTTRQRHGLELK